MPPEPNTNRSVTRALVVLVAMTRADRTKWTLDEIAESAGLPKSTVHRLLATLEAQGFVRHAHDGYGHYRLGLMSAVVGSAALRTLRPHREIRAILEGLAEQCRESIGLSVLHGADAVIVDKAGLARPVRATLTAGTRVPAAATAAGRVLLAHRSDEEVRSLLFSGGLDDVDAALERVVAVRESGYSLEVEEYEPGLACLAVPVISTAGRVTHALSVAAPTSRMDPSSVEAHLAALTAGVGDLAPLVDLDDLTDG